MKKNMFSFLFIFAIALHANISEVFQEKINHYLSKINQEYRLEDNINNSVNSNFSMNFNYYKKFKEGFNKSEISAEDTISSYLLIENDTTINNDLLLIENAEVIVRNCSLRLNGNITLFSNAVFSVDSATFIFPQQYIYQYEITCYDSSLFEIKNSTLNSTSLPISAATILNSTINIENTFMDNSFITFTLIHTSSINIINTTKAGEFVLYTNDSAHLKISHSDSVLIWFGFPKNSTGIIDPIPSINDWIDSLNFPNPSCTGINYYLEIDSVHGIYSGIMVSDSADVTVKNGDLLTAGNIFEGEITDTITGLIDGSYYNDWIAPLPLRNLHLINVTVNAWNLYFFGTQNILLKNSIFGEVLTLSNSDINIENSICDGFGGHIGSLETSLLTTFYSTFYCDALVEDQSFALFIMSNFMIGKLITKDRGLSLVYNSSMQEPIVEDSATVFIIGLNPPSPAYINDSVSIQGSASIRRTYISPFNFEKYRLYYAPSSDTSMFIPMCDYITTQVEDDELCIFNTYGLSQGEYIIKLGYYFSAYSLSDSLFFNNIIYLTENVGVEEEIVINYPKFLLTNNIFSDIADIKYYIPKYSNIEISLFNISGQKVKTMYYGFLNEGEYSLKLNTREFPEGFYFIEINTEKYPTEIKKILFIR